jgi:hypothetical protein
MTWACHDRCRSSCRSCCSPRDRERGYDPLKERSRANTAACRPVNTPATWTSAKPGGRGRPARASTDGFLSSCTCRFPAPNPGRSGRTTRLLRSSCAPKNTSSRSGRRRPRRWPRHGSEYILPWSPGAMPMPLSSIGARNDLVDPDLEHVAGRGPFDIDRAGQGVRPAAGEVGAPWLRSSLPICRTTASSARWTPAIPGSAAFSDACVLRPLLRFRSSPKSLTKPEPATSPLGRSCQNSCYLLPTRNTFRRDWSL